jgi:transposase
VILCWALLNAIFCVLWTGCQWRALPKDLPPIDSASHDDVSRLVTGRSMCFAVDLDQAFKNIDCMSAILRCQSTMVLNV